MRSTRKGSRLVMFCAGVLDGRLDHAEVQIDRLALALEVVGAAPPRSPQLDAQQLGQRADIDHVGDIGAQVGVGAGVLGHLLHRQSVVGDVVAVFGELPSSGR